MTIYPDLFSSGLKMLAALALILVALFFTSYFMKKYLKRGLAGSKQNLIRVLSNTYIGVKKSISLVEIPGALLVLGITHDNISLLSKIEKKETLEQFKKENQMQTSFSDHLHNLSNKVKERNKDG